MKKTISIVGGVFALLLLLTLILFVRVATVKPGSVGILVPLYGKSKDSQTYDIVRGRRWYNPFYEDIYLFPTYMQQVVWSQDKNEGHEADESLTFQSSEGKSVNCDVAVAYYFKEESIPHVFRELRQTPEDITHGYLRSKVRNAFVLSGHSMKISELLGNKVGDLLDAVKHQLEEELGPKGFVFDMVSIVGKMRVDKEVEEAIAATIKAQQKAIEAENKVKQSEAEARQEIAKAEGKAKSEIAEAEGKATSLLMIAKAETEANKVLHESLTVPVLRYQALRTWDGKVPLVVGQGATPFLSLPTGK